MHRVGLALRADLACLSASSQSALPRCQRCFESHPLRHFLPQNPNSRNLRALRIRSGPESGLWLGLVGPTLPKTLPKIEWAGSGMTKNYDQRGIPPRSRARKAVSRLTSLSWLEIWRECLLPVPDSSPVSPCYYWRRPACSRSNIATARMSRRIASTPVKPAPSPMTVRIA